MKGLFITLEGNEGCGKSTQIKLLAAYLRKKGRKVFVTREPGGTPVGEEVRKILLSTKHREMSSECETLLYMASRAQLVKEVILPRLKKGETVLCDRWLDATIAYQGYAGGVDVKWIEKLGEGATQGLKPALTLYLDLPVKEGLKRTQHRGRLDRIELKKLAFHTNVRKGFMAIFSEDPGRFRRLALRSEETISEVHERIKAEADRVL